MLRKRLLSGLTGRRFSRLAGRSPRDAMRSGWNMSTNLSLSGTMTTLGQEDELAVCPLELAAVRGGLTVEGRKSFSRLLWVGKHTTITADA